MATRQTLTDTEVDQATAVDGGQLWRYFVIFVFVMFFACAWIGQQVTFPLVPAIGGLARKLPNSLQVTGIFALLALSIFGACYPVCAWAAKRFRRNLSNSPARFCVDDPRFSESSAER